VKADLSNKNQRESEVNSMNGQNQKLYWVCACCSLLLSLLFIVRAFTAITEERRRRGSGALVSVSCFGLCFASRGRKYDVESNPMFDRPVLINAPPFKSARAHKPTFAKRLIVANDP
jgi:hypothetical protein